MSSKRFNYIISNPPYQDSTSINNRSQPVYPLFYDIAGKIAGTYIIISPARFLFDTGLTPKDWNRKMLNDNHLKILEYEEDSSKIFPGTNIKGGLGIFYRNNNENYGAIKEFIPDDMIRKIAGHFVKNEEENISSLIYGGRSDLKFTEEFLSDFPQSITDRINSISEQHTKITKLSPNEEYELKSSSFTVLPYAFSEKAPENSRKTYRILGLEKGRRTYRYILQKYMRPRYSSNNIKNYKVFIPESNGSGKFGEVLSTPVIGEPFESCTPTFLSLGNFKNREEAENALKYIKTKSVRTLLGILKKTQHNPSTTWAYIPLQNFTSSSDIDWSKSIPEIDRQLYKKYNLTPDEIEFIEKNVKEMK